MGKEQDCDKILKHELFDLAGAMRDVTSQILSRHSSLTETGNQGGLSSRRS